MSECEWMSMNPGATIRPLASMTRPAFAPGSRWPMAAIRSPRIARSPSNHGFPVPSTIRPPRMRMSQGSSATAGGWPEARPGSVRTTHVTKTSNGLIILAPRSQNLDMRRVRFQADRGVRTGKPRSPFDEHRPIMTNRAREEYRYEKLTWPEINDAVELDKVCVVPCGAVEQHGHHLPLDVDLVCPVGVAAGAGKAIPDTLLVLPVVAYGYTGHVMDFPGTINTHYEHFIDQVLDITRSLAYHGFKKIVLLNGHGSNWPSLDLAARRTNLETDAECIPVCWWNLLTVDKAFLPRWRQSK